MQFDLITLTGVKFSGVVYEIILPTLDGEIGVLPGHMPLVSAATKGVISVRHKANDRDDQMEYFATNGGVIEITNTTVHVLVDEADHEDEINEAEAQKAYELAKKMKDEATDQVSLEQAQSLIDRHEVRLHVAGLKRRRR
ncbi:MAG: F0F1 ATP synthase subunit epsilon [Candidatus Saccharimonadales bacterium]